MKCKVVKVNEVSTVKKSGDGKELRKQDVMVADETGSSRLVLWEDDVNSLEEGTSYCLVNMGCVNMVQLSISLSLQKAPRKWLLI